MGTYECGEWGVSVNASCARCDEPLVNDVLTKEDGSGVQISKYPNDHGKIKAAMCCG